MKKAKVDQLIKRFSREAFGAGKQEGLLRRPAVGDALADLCERCQRPLVDCGAVELGYAKLILECREAQLENTQRALASANALIAHARVLLLRTREALDLALAESEPDEPEGDGG